jgi:predicted transport protein
MPVNVEPTDEYETPRKVKTATTKSHSDTLRARANTALLLRELGGPDEFTDEEDAQAKELFKLVDGQDPSKEVQKQQISALENPGIALALGGYIAHYDQQVIADKVQLRNIAINRLLEMSQDDDQKIAIKAVELIGKASDLFTEHQEITITHKNSIELQEAIREKIKLLMQMNTIDITPQPEKLENTIDE